MKIVVSLLMHTVCFQLYPKSHMLWSRIKLFENWESCAHCLINFSHTRPLNWRKLKANWIAFRSNNFILILHIKPIINIVWFYSMDTSNFTYISLTEISIQFFPLHIQYTFFFFLIGSYISSILISSQIHIRMKFDSMLLFEAIRF